MGLMDMLSGMLGKKAAPKTGNGLLDANTLHLRGQTSSDPHGIARQLQRLIHRLELEFRACADPLLRC